MRIIVIFLLSLLALTLRGQEIILSGQVSDAKDKSPLQDVNIVVNPRNGKSIIAYAISASDGTFRMKSDAASMKDAILVLSYLGYQSQSIAITEGKEHYVIMLSPQAIDIKEIIVKAPKVRVKGDTITYNVASFSKEGDKTIGDVLNKLPGIRVNEDGRISYQGMQINKFYIEGMDLLGGKYGIATHNISNKDIGSVEILENHQPIKALNGLNLSEQAAINLRLKEKTKQRWIGNIQGGIGLSTASPLWDEQVIAMHFNKAFQSLNTYKTNNTGNDITKEFKSFDFNTIRYARQKLTDYISSVPAYPRELNRDRELFNRTHQATSNNLFRLKNGFSISTSIGVASHRVDAEKQTTTAYYHTDADTTIVFEEAKSLFDQKTIAVGVTLEANKEEYNLTNKLQSDFSWIDLNNRINKLTQQNNTQTKLLTNDLYLLKKINNNYLIFSSYTFAQSHPQHMKVIAAQKLQHQQIEQSKFFSDHKIEFGIPWKRVVINATAGIKIMARKMQSTQSGVEQIGDQQSNSTMYYTGFYLQPRVEYTVGKLKSYLSLPVNFYTTRYSEKVSPSKTTVVQTVFDPDLYIAYTINPRFKIGISAAINHDPISESSFYSGYIMQSYRSFAKGYPVYKLSSQKVIKGTFFYKRPLEETFAELSIRHTWNTTPYILLQEVSNSYIFSSYQEGENTNRRLNIAGSLSKGIAFLKGYVFLDATYSTRHSQLIRNHNKVSTTQRSWSLSPRLEIDLSRQITMKYKLNYHHSILEPDEGETRIKKDALVQQLSLRLTPIPQLSVQISGEHYADKSTGEKSKAIFLGDMTASYHLTKAWEAECTLKNIFNEQSYSYMSFTDEAGSIFRNYRIRPRNILLSIKYSY